MSEIIIADEIKYRYIFMGAAQAKIDHLKHTGVSFIWMLDGKVQL